MEIDVSKDRGIEELKVTFCEGEEPQKQKIDVFLLADRLSAVFSRAAKEEMRKEQAWPLLKDEWQKVGFKIPEEGFNTVYAVSQKLMAGCVERKKKFDEITWGTGDEWPALPDSTKAA